MSIIVDNDNCNVCCECINICSSEVLGIRSGKVMALKNEECQLCESCSMICENESIKVIFGE